MVGGGGLLFVGCVGEGILVVFQGVGCRSVVLRYGYIQGCRWETEREKRGGREKDREGERERGGEEREIEDREKEERERG